MASSCGVGMPTSRQLELSKDEELKQVLTADETHRRELVALFRELRSFAVSNAEYFSELGGREDASPVTRRFYLASSSLHEHLDRGIQPGVEYLLSIAYMYDLDTSTKANGYRSIIHVVERCCHRLLALSRYIACHRESLLFRSEHYSLELDAFVTTLGQLRACLYYLHKLVSYCQVGRDHLGTLFPDEYATSAKDRQVAEQLMNEFESLCQDSFYGRCLGFQFCESMVRPLTTINLVLASFSEGYGYVSAVRQIASTVLGGGKYMIDPDSRGRQVVNATRNGDIGFCKAFWSLAENSFMHKVPSLMCPSVLVNHVFTIAAEPFELDHVNGIEPVTITVPCAHTGPGPVSVRLMSHVLRQGQDIFMKMSSSASAPKSPALIIQCHGGGFVAQSSASHQIYLRHWACATTVPILCVDYSLAPEHTYPRQLEEVFFAYCWAIKNCHFLGSTAEKVCIVGDSAGGTLAVATAMRAISFGVRAPDAVLSVYGCMLVKYTPSPSRMLSLMDPLLPLGVLPKCLSAYAGVSINSSSPVLEFPASDVDDGSSSVFASCQNEAESTLSVVSSDVSPPPPLLKCSASTMCASDDSGFIDASVSSCIAGNMPFANVTRLSSSQPLRAKLTLNLESLHRRQHSSSSVSKSTSTPVFATPVESPSQLDAQTCDRDAVCMSSRHSSAVFSTPTYAKMRHFAQSPIQPFGRSTVNVARNPYMSPLLAGDDLLAEMCPVYFITCHLDPMLDDSVSFAQRLRKLGRMAHLDVLDGLPHGFLNFALVSSEAKAGSELCVRRLRHVLGIGDRGVSDDTAITTNSSSTQ